jgi:hypothetical protein
MNCINDYSSLKCWHDYGVLLFAPTKPFELSELAEKIAFVDEYKSFLDSKGTLQLFKTLSRQVLTLMENRDVLPEEKRNRLLQKVGQRIDQVFGIQKEYERLVRT